MTAHAGWYLSNGAPSEQVIRALTESLHYHGPDGVRVHAAGPLVTACGAFQTTVDPVVCTQPVTLPSGQWLTFDGRLDNRDELAVAYASRQEPASDAVLAAQTFLKGGAPELRHLLGDWALAIATDDEPFVILARDYAGTRPLYYAIRPEGIVWSSELETFRALGYTDHVDEDYCAEFLIGNLDVTRTPYKGIASVRPGHAVLWRAGSISDVTLWEPEPTNRLRYAHDRDYAEHFKDLFIRAVAARLRVTAPPWLELSGGLDSSAIVCVASGLVRSGAVPVSSLVPIAYVFDRAKGADETTYRAYVEEAIGVRADRLLESSFPLFEYRTGHPPPATPQPGPGRTMALATLMAGRSGRVVLSGQGGDAIMWSSQRYYPLLADLLRSGSCLELVKETYALSRATATPLFHIWKEQLWTSRARGLARRRLQWKGASPSECAALEAVQSAISILSMQHFRSCGQIEASYPYLDRRIVSFMLSVPFGQRLRPGISRVLHRHALAGILPEPIRTRRTKASGAEVVGQALRHEWPTIERLFAQDARVGALGLIEPSSIRIALADARNGHLENVFYLLRAIALESWLRAREGASPALTATLPPRCHSTHTPNQMRLGVLSKGR